MPRKGPASKREIIPDPVYGSKLVSQLINHLLMGGKKSLSEKIVYGAFEKIAKKADDPIAVYRKAINNVRPLLKVKSRRVGGATYQVPIEVPPKQGTTLALRWVIDFARARKGKTMSEKLAAELTEAASGGGLAVKKKEDTHRMAEANRAFAHYRW
jgi:small subunit ribosomal protein S7